MGKSFLLPVILGLILTAAAIAPAQEADSVEFTYGIVGMKSGQPDQLFEVTNEDTLASGDYFKINYRLHGATCFYIILEASDGSYFLYHAVTHGKGAGVTHGSATALDWLQLDDNTGVERVYMICSGEQLVDLEQQFEKYNDSDGKSRDRYARKIGTELAMVTMAEDGAAPPLRARLDRPDTIGASYRGVDEEEKTRITADQLYQHTAGKGIAWEVVEIIHE